MVEKEPDSDNGGGKFRVSIFDEHFNARAVEIADPKVTGALIAEAAGVHPVTDFMILQHLNNGELESLRPTETTDLAGKGIERFFVIRGSETYRFLVEGLSMEWPRPSILGKHVKFLARESGDEILVLCRAEGEQVIANEAEVDLNPDGVEELKFRRKPKPVTVIYNQEHRFELEPRVYTTEELLAIFKVPKGYKLDLITADGEWRELVAGEKILIVDGMEFASHPPRGQSA